MAAGSKRAVRVDSLSKLMMDEHQKINKKMLHQQVIESEKALAQLVAQLP